ncbi:hypothetical protein GCK72_008650 [Caenorhabditis remanei]|uniref:Uncharacterized protein n=1 Tax=Caenorhabditis remanei TaxID=31234 RepID=A0A6A5H076_CAERE|nr:hypothetical protein GCK72_008650 [Caenorhabditis remanei]KAF1760401.1 hypothetical protein GCK72_008650 [Caenorhabditis remanei]
MMNPKILTVCLFEETVTAASAAMKIFQRNHLDVERPIVLDARPSASRNSSIVSQKYLAWLDNANKVDIASSGTTGERKFLRERHEVKLVWECKVEKQRSKNPVMAKLFEEYEPIGLMEMEKALSGGRTEAFRLMADDSRRIMKHVDVVSMYPAVKDKATCIATNSTCAELTKKYKDSYFVGFMTAGMSMDGIIANSMSDVQPCIQCKTVIVCLHMRTIKPVGRHFIINLSMSDTLGKLGSFSANEPVEIFGVRWILIAFAAQKT